MSCPRGAAPAPGECPHAAPCTVCSCNWRREVQASELQAACNIGQRFRIAAVPTEPVLRHCRGLSKMLCESIGMMGWPSLAEQQALLRPCPMNSLPMLDGQCTYHMKRKPCVLGCQAGGDAMPLSSKHVLPRRSIACSATATRAAHPQRLVGSGVEALASGEHVVGARALSVRVGSRNVRVCAIGIDVVCSGAKPPLDNLICFFYVHKGLLSLYRTACQAKPSLEVFSPKICATPSSLPLT